MLRVQNVDQRAEPGAPADVPVRPRILLILTELPPRVGGMQTHAMYLSRYLARRGYPIEVVTYRPADAEEREAAASFDADLERPIHRSLSRLGFWHNLDVLTRLGLHFRPHLVYASTVFYGLLGPRLGVPVICRSVGNDVMRPWIAYPFRPGSRFASSPWLERSLYRLFCRLEHPAWMEGLLRNARRRLMERSARETARILANSAFTQRLLQSIGVPDGRIEVVVGGVDARRFARPSVDRVSFRLPLGLPPDRYVLVTTCRLEAKKGIDFLLRAFFRLRGLMPDAHLVIVGDGHHGRRYRELAGSLGLGDCVTFTGRIPHEDVHTYYWGSDLFVLASRESVHPATGIRDAETMGRVLCEANAAGTPVVASRSGGIPSVIAHGENGLLFEPDATDDFLGQVMRLRGQPGLAARLVDDGLEAARTRFDWSVVLAAHERAFREVLTAAGCPGANGCLIA